MPTIDYSHRDVVDKLAIGAGDIIAIDEDAGPLDADLRARITARSDRRYQGDEAANVVIVMANDRTDIVATLQRWRQVLDQAGGIWILTPKRGFPGYLDQRELIPLGAAAGLVDNKTCSVSESISAMRFVIRKRDRKVTLPDPTSGGH